MNAALFNRFLLPAVSMACLPAAVADDAPWWEAPPLTAMWEKAVAQRAGRPAVLPPGVEMMAIGSPVLAAQPLVLSGLTHLVTFGDMKAYMEFAEALKHDPDCLMAHWGICMSLIGAGPEFQQERVQSMKRLKELALQPGCPEHERAYADALILLLMKGLKESLGSWKTLYETWRRDPYAPLFYAMLVRDGYDASGKPEEGQTEALRVVQEVLAVRPDSYAALFMRVLLEETAPVIAPETVTFARKAVEVNPQAASARHLLGHMLFRTGDYQAASAAFKESEALNQAWQKERKVPLAWNDGYVRSLIYRAAAEFCAGRYKEAEAVARKAAALPLDKEHPLAAGTLLQIWEARNLPVRLMLSRPELPKLELLLKESPGPLPKGFPDLSNGMMAMSSQYMGAMYAARDGKTAAVASRFNKLSSVLQLMVDGASVAYKQMSMTYWNRCFMMGGTYAMEIRAAMFPDTAHIWLADAIKGQRFASMLLPPLLPYPEEWVLARVHLKAGKYQECLDACSQGLKRFPNHAGVLATMQQARDGMNKSTSNKPSIKK